MTRVNSNRKGKDGERFAVNFLKDLGYIDARRTQQYRGGQQSADVECPDSLPHLHIEVKCGRASQGKIDLGCTGLTAACEQAARDSDGRPWCVLWKPTGCSQWRLTFDMRLIAADVLLVTTIASNAEILVALELLNERGVE